VPPTALVGREREVAAARALLRDGGVRLLTLTGPPGIGKTQLALAAAAALEGSFADGVRFVPLAPLADPRLVASAIGHALEVRETGELSLVDGLKAYLHGRHLLLVLDNFEHVLEAAPLVSELRA
jgi:predicted ATPase